jgi:acetyltransferase-like isoleucine patch superfamily enzyme
MKNIVLQLLFIFLPWRIRRPLLRYFLNFDIDKSAHIGLSLVIQSNLRMDAESRIGHLNVVKGLSLLHMHERSSIGKLNWISGYAISEKKHFGHVKNRSPELILKEHAAITNRHLIDCTDRVHIGKYTTLAGFRSQILTHSIDLYRSIQDCSPVYIGDYCFIGTACVLLNGSKLPNYSVLGACALLNSQHEDEFTLYGGVPAKPLATLGRETQYFQRETGFVK